MSVFVTNVASMLGIGVAVDYSLFLLSRYREELHGGTDRAEALDVAMRTSGATVVFSGMTVIVVARRAVPARLDGRCARWRSARSSSWRSRCSAP